MNVNIDVQSLCRPRNRLRGIPYYTLNLLDNLIKRNNNDYSVSFFDLNSQENYMQLIKEYIPQNSYEKLCVYECKEISCSEILSANKAGKSELYCNKTFSQYIGANADVYHFPNPFEVPFNIPENSVITIYDCIALMENISFNEHSRKVFKATIEYIKRNNKISIITDSECIKNDLINICEIDPERIFVIYAGYDKTIHYPEKNDELLCNMGIEGPFLLYLGVLDFRKGIVNILDSFSYIKPFFKDLKLVLAGDLNPFVKDIPEKLKDYMYIDDVIQTGFVNDEQKRVLMSSAEAFLFPSEYEGFGLPIIEAMACGAPVITTNVSSLPEIGGEAALYVSPKNPVELAESIKKLLNSESLRKELVSKGFENIKQFSWNKTAELTEKVYKIAASK